MAHIIINPSLSDAIAYNLFFNPQKCAEVSTILELANSMRRTIVIIMFFSFCVTIFKIFHRLVLKCSRVKSYHPSLAT